MADVLNLPVDSIDASGDRSDPKDAAKSPEATESSPLPPPPPLPLPLGGQLLPRRRDRDSRERREDRDRDIDRPPTRPARDYYDRNRSPPPPPPRERERDRERDRSYKRRSSPGSPPPPYRDRRRGDRSPPFPAYKRSRKDDGGGYEGRRGSPRGGSGPGDRRLGYDHPGGYERDMAGRPGYVDARSHGRFGGRAPGGYPDWDMSRGGFGDASTTGNAKREGLMSYKQFIQELEDDILPAEAERRYQEYKSEYISTQKRAYFDAHKDEEWLRDKYHPTNIPSVIERRNELARKTAKDFLLDLQSGALDLGPGANALSSNVTEQNSDQNSDEEVDTGGKRRRHARGATKEIDLNTATPKAHPVSCEPRRIQVDVEQAQALVRKLDSEKGIEENILCGLDNDKMNRERSHGGSTGPVIIIRGLTSVKGLEGIELLDTLITYLWRIHGVDYYGMVEKSEPKGLRHVRPEDKSSGVKINGTEWEKKLDSFWQDRLKGQGPLEIMAAKEKIEAASVEVLDPHVRKIRDEKYGWKYGCGAKGCTKLFHAAEFVHKHLKLKHPELVMELTTKLRDDLYFQNYMNDADAPGGTPVTMQSLPKDKPLKRRLGIESRLKDVRGFRRDIENQPNSTETYDRSEVDNDVPDGKNSDEPIFDTFGGQHMRVGPPFPSDMPPPPVLMPVPGAGPLGPFVPAPPEVAMQMFREQSGPSSFEGSGRNGRSGPPLSGPSPVLALPPNFRQDSRRLRSYQDLDAPDDEVTVIDYRSL